ncbi:hypothetical protein BY996DRAFT_3290734 [Phakopsora pachyrhizi]|nr:hypothetical protein BY996DRAFT_3290734 [Phakopsora pachyrhizi]
MASTSKPQTDFEAINDAVGISGVDIAAEEELAKQQSVMYGRTRGRGSVHSQRGWSAPPQRVKIMEFLDKPALTLMVQHIAASYQLKTLEPAILDVLSQAAEHRIHSLIIDSIAAKDHRVASNHLRAPPLYPGPTQKGKQKEKAPEAMYDQLIYDEPERILSMLARVEGEEERKARTDREMNGRKEEEQQQQQQQQQQQDSNNNSTMTLDLSQPTPSSTLNEPNKNQPPDQFGAEGRTNQKTNKKEKKRKREGPGQQARSMTEDARARQSNQTAMRSVGGRSKYSWLSGGVVKPNLNKSATIKNLNSTSIMASLPAPKFAPQSASGLNQASDDKNKLLSSKKEQSGVGCGNMEINDSNQTSKGEFKQGAGGVSSRLGGILPGSHLSNQETGGVGLRDCLFALERERGTGAGRGSGTFLRGIIVVSGSGGVFVNFELIETVFFFF